MTPLRLHGADPAQLREVALAWWAAPLASVLLQEAPEATAVRLRISADGEGRLVGRLRPEKGTTAGWAGRVEAAARRVLLAGADALDDDEGFWRAFSSYCPPDSAVDVLRITCDERGNSKAEWLAEPWCDDAHAPAEVRYRAQARGELDPDVAEVLDGLEALDQRDALAVAAMSLIEALRYTRGPEPREALGRLEALLRQLS